MTGRPRWSHDLWQEYGGTFIGKGYPSSPLAYKNKLIVQVGGAGRALMAFDLIDGRTGDFRTRISYTPMGGLSFSTKMARSVWQRRLLKD